MISRIQLHSRKYSTSIPRFARILASDPIEKVCGDIFRARGHELIEKPGISKVDLLKIVGDYEGLVVRSATKVTKDVIEAGVNLKLIGRAGTGVDNIDSKSATNKGILVVNTPGGNTISTAELCVAHIVGLARHISQATASVKSGKWERSKYTGAELNGKTLGIIGMGRIGREVASRCQGLGMNVIGYDPVLSENAARSFGVVPVSLDDLFGQCDYITLHTPMTKETRNIINQHSLQKCKKGVKIINCARGGLVDEKALLAAILSGHVGGAGLDVLEEEPPVAESEELRLHPKVVFTPHLGASTSDAQIRVAKQIAENMCDILDGGEYRGVVNAPDLSAINKVAGLKPFVLLAEKIGSVHAQLLGSSKVNAVSITLRGKLVADSRVTDILKSALLKGMLGSLSDSTSVSYVNAISTAQEMGLEVNINMSETTMAQSGYTDTITVDVELEGLLNMTRTIEGTIFGENDVRITEIDGFPISFPEGESVLLFNNVDEPGVLYKVSKKLADIGINVLQLSVGRKSNAKKALCVLILDSTMPKEVVSTFGKDLGLSNVMQLEFDKNEDPIFRVRDSGVKDKDVGMAKPAVRPRHPEFSSGPCKKRPGYSLNTLRTDVLGRSHRSKLGKGRIMKALEDTKRILGVPQEYFCGIVPASDTGAMEMAMWSMLGPKPVDVCYWEAFGKGWKEDIVSHLKIPSVREFSAPYGSISDLSATNSDHDIIFTYNGTTSGVRVPNLDWISSSRTGLTFNDATSAAFAMDIDWSKVDVTTFSWQKVLGGEGAHGVLILSPRAVERLETYKCPRALPKIFRMTKTDKAGKITFEKSIFSGDTINTPSMLCVEDYLDALEWAESVGGLAGLQKRSLNNLSIMEKFVGENPWISFLAEDPAIRSSTSVCFKMQLTQPQTKKFVSLLEAEGVAFDIGSYRDAPDGLRIWCGATVSPEDLEALLPWLKWAYEACQV